MTENEITIAELRGALKDHKAEIGHLRRELAAVTAQRDAAKRLLETPGVNAALFPSDDASNAPMARRSE